MEQKSKITKIELNEDGTVHLVFESSNSVVDIPRLNLVPMYINHDTKGYEAMDWYYGVSNYIREFNASLEVETKHHGIEILPDENEVYYWVGPSDEIIEKL